MARNRGWWVAVSSPWPRLAVVGVAPGVASHDANDLHWLLQVLCK